MPFSDSALDYKRLAEQMLSSHEDERLQQSRDIHDEVCSRLVGLLIQMQSLQGAVTSEDAEERFALIIDDCKAALVSAQRISTGLRPVMIDNLGLIPSIKQLANDYAYKFDVQTKVVNHDHKLYNRQRNNKNVKLIADRIGIIEFEPILTDRQRIEIYRIVQEAMTNVIKHANASRITITSRTTDDHYIIRVMDNGIGISDTNKILSRGIGLLSMLERATVAEGNLKIRTQPGRGTVLSILVKVK